MGYAIATVTGGLGDEAHYKVLAAIRTLALANGWTQLRYVNAGADRELILNSPGLSGTEDIYIGFKTYQSVDSDYYNIAFGVFTGYVDGNTFEGQPGARLSGVPCHNNAVTYFMTANAQRIAACFKVGTPVYVHGYAGKMFQYSRPGEFPSPLVCAGHFDGKEPRRFSDLEQQMPYYGHSIDETATSGFDWEASKLWLREQNGDWDKQYHFPWNNGGQTHGVLFGPQPTRPAGVNYQPQPIILYDTDGSRGNVWGELDGVTAITGFNNNSENVLQQGGSSIIDQSGMSVLQAVNAIRGVGGRAHVILQDTNRTGFNNFIALEMS